MKQPTREELAFAISRGFCKYSKSNTEISTGLGAAILDEMMETLNPPTDPLAVDERHIGMLCDMWDGDDKKTPRILKGINCGLFISESINGIPGSQFTKARLHVGIHWFKWEGGMECPTADSAIVLAKYKAKVKLWNYAGNADWENIIAYLPEENL